MFRLLRKVRLAAQRNALSTMICQAASPSSVYHIGALSRRWGTFNTSRPAMEVLNIKVPTMGDSITEGTIVEWTAQVGQLVKEGDVVALIETDKVTVDIKAEVDGVLVDQFGAVDDNVEVGANLYQIDTEATESPGGFFEVTAEEEIETPAEAAEAPSTNSESTRVPLIKFLGKAGWAKRRTPSPLSPEADIAVGIPPAVGGPSRVTVAAPDLGPMYGRLAFTEREMEALVSGGADEAPEIISSSTGAAFGN